MRSTNAATTATITRAKTIVFIVLLVRASMKE